MTLRCKTLVTYDYWIPTVHGGDSTTVAKPQANEILNAFSFFKVNLENFFRVETALNPFGFDSDFSFG